MASPSAPDVLVVTPTRAALAVCEAVGRCTPEETPDIVLEAYRNYRQSLECPVRWQSNYEAGDGQLVCDNCGIDADEPHDLTVCIDNIKADGISIDRQLADLHKQECAAAEARGRLQGAAEWILCSERMPEDDAQVLFTWGDDLTDGPVVCMGRWIAGDDGYWVDLDNDCADRDGEPQKRWPGEVTHWMPLPSPPTKEGS